MRRWIGHAVVLVMGVAGVGLAIAGQAPLRATDPDVAISHRDRVYAAEQFSNTVSVIDPADNRLLGVIRLGDPAPTNFSPLYRGQVLVHGLGFSPDHRTLAVVSIGSNSVTFIDTLTNAVKHTTYVGRAPHEAFFTPDGQEVWVTIRGESHVLVLDATTSFGSRRRTARVCRSFHPMERMALSVRRSLQRPKSFRSQITGSSVESLRRAPSVPTSQQHPTATRSGSRLRTRD